MSWFSWVESITIEGNTMPKEKPRAEPEKSPLQAVAEREATRGALIGRLAKEAAMWRAFAQGCKTGRHICEHNVYFGYKDYPSPLILAMDELSAPAWKAFAESMANQAEQRLREILG